MSSPITQDLPAGRSTTVGERMRSHPGLYWAILGVSIALIFANFWHSFVDIYHNWRLPDSLYSHALIIPPISLFFAWRLRREVLAAPYVSGTWLGFTCLLGGCLLLLLGDFLGFMTLVHIALLPVLTGICLIVLGLRATAILWFPLAFIFFMFPMPYSIISVISFQSKIFATEAAVALGKACTIPLVQDGSYVHLRAGDKLLVGDVCGGMRSLIALLAFGVLMAYISKTRWWARILIVLVSPVVAVVANVARIFFLCLVGYFGGSQAATGLVHDASGIGIFAVAFALLFTVEAILRKVAPADVKVGAVSAAAPPPQTASAQGVALMFTVYGVMLALLGATAVIHWTINLRRDAATEMASFNPDLSLPSEIDYYRQYRGDIDPGDDVREKLDTSSILMRWYVGPGGQPILLTIVYAGQTRRSLHFPETCLVGQGWEVEKAYSAPVGIEFEARRLVIFQREEKQAVLYWLKTGDKFTSSGFMNALYWAREQLMFGTPTSSMIKLSMPFGPGKSEEEAFAVLDDFAARLTPYVMEHIK